MSRLIQSTRSVMESADSGLEKLMDEAIANIEDFDEEEADNAVASVYGKDDPILTEIIQDGIENPEENFDQVPPVQSDEVSSDEYEEGVTMIDSRYTNDFDDATEATTLGILESLIGEEGHADAVHEDKRTDSSVSALESIVNMVATESYDDCNWEEDNDGWEDNVNDLDRDNPEDLIEDAETTFQPEPTKISTRREMHPDEEVATKESLDYLDALLEACEGDDCDTSDVDDVDIDDTDDTDDDVDADDVDEGCAKESAAIDELLEIF